MRHHTADLNVSVSAAGIKSLFKRSAEAMLFAAIKKAGTRPAAATEIRCSAGNIRELLHDFLNEILYIVYVKRKDVSSIKVIMLDEDQAKIVAVALVSKRDIRPDRFIREIKSATYHGLSVKKTKGKWKAVFLLDV